MNTRRTDVRPKEILLKVENNLLRCAIPILDKAKHITIPGFDGIPLYDVGVFFLKGVFKGSVNIRASAVAYSLILAIFPAIIFVFTLIPYIPIPNFQEQLLLLIQSMSPTSAYTAIQTTIEEIVTRQNGGLLSIGFALALIFSTNGIGALIGVFNASVNVVETRSWFAQQLISLLLVLILSSLVAIGIALITVTQSILKRLVLEGLLQVNFTYYLIIVGKWIVILAVFYFAFSFLYYLAPARKSKWHFISAGSTVATILAILVTVFFKEYINHFGRYNVLYGSIGALPVVMIMVYLNCIAIIVGFELNVGIVAARREKKSLAEIQEIQEKKSEKN